MVALENCHFFFHVFNNNAQKLYIKNVWKPLEVAFKQSSYSKHLVEKIACVLSEFRFVLFQKTKNNPSKYADFYCDLAKLYEYL